jgi:enediyne biosynthesis protein E4
MRVSVLAIIGLLAVSSCTKSSKFQLLDPKETGVDFNNLISESDTFNLMKYEYIYNGAGVGVADLNNDGLQDLIFAGNMVSTKVYLNLGNFKFKDITANFEGLDNSQWYSGVTVTDINNDGFPDIYLTSTSNTDPEKRRNRLWVNNGTQGGKDPTFKEMAASYGIADTCWSVNAAFLDYDRDGYLDLYVLNNTVNSRMNTNYRPKVTDGSSLNNDRLYHNNGDGTFTDVTKKAGILIEGFGLGLAVGDVNKDGYPDIYVSNDFVSNDLLYINQRNGTFRNEIAKYMSYQSRSSMGNDMADVNNDGNPDMYTMDMLPQTNLKKKQTINGYSYIYYLNDQKYGFEHQYVRNMLHLHNGFINGEMLPFSEEGQMMGVSATDWSWSPLFADFDNDGKKDLLVTNGFPKDETDKDWTRFKSEAAGAYASDQLVIDMAPAVKIPNLAFENIGEKGFVKRTDWLPDVPSFSYGAAFVDLDNDGDLDYVVNNMNDKAFILRNMSRERDKKSTNYLGIRLKGKEGNTPAFGAKAELWAGGKYQFSENFLTRGYASSVDPVIHFGLGTLTTVDSLRITWPASGRITVLKSFPADQILDLNEKDSQPAYALAPVANDYLFNKVDSSLKYTHEQKEFIDYFTNQPIIPHKFSQIGPRMAKGDLDNDGRDELLVGSTMQLPTTAYKKVGENFVKVFFDGLTTVKNYAEADLAIVDINKDGLNDVVAVAGGYANKDEKEYVHYLYENRNGKFSAVQLPIQPFPASVVRVCDYNHDGYPDLFIGARVKKGMFPYSNHSWFLMNDKGKFTEKSCSKIDLGMITDAVWTDFDKDGWEDLIVTREFNSIVLLKNEGGKNFKPVSIPAIENQHGLWFSIVKGDFNNDGYDDYILGNLGVDNRFSASDKYPMNLYAINLDNDGNLDPVLTAFWPDEKGEMKEYTMNYLDELWSQSKYFENKYNGYTAFSKITVPEMLDSKIMKRLEFKLYVNTTESCILWNNKGTFKMEKLPLALQVSPLKKMIAEDFNSDGYTDVLIGGNDYTYEIGTGNYDAVKGIVLINRRNQQKKDEFSFNMLQPSQSGILLQGMIESLLYFKGDTSLVVAGFNRAPAKVFEHINKKAEKN